MEELEGMSVASVINLMPSAKEQISEFNRQLKYELMSGREEPLKLLAKLKYIEKCVSDFLKDDEVYEVFTDAMNGDKRFEGYGCVFETAETGTKYDYTGSSEWNEFENSIKEIREQQKSVETRLKTATSKTPYVDSITGELIFGIPKSSRSSIKVTLK